MTPEPIASPVPVWPVVGSVSVTPSATIVTTAGLTALTMSTVAWLPEAFPVLAFWPAGSCAVLETGVVAGVWAVAVTSAYVPPDASSADPRTAPRTNAGPTARRGRGSRVGGVAEGVGSGVAAATAGWAGTPVGVNGRNGSYIGFLQPRRTIDVLALSGAQDPIVESVSES